MTRAPKRSLILAILLVLICLSFWTGSRYPDLMQKGEAGPNLVLDGIGFDSVMLVLESDSTGVKIFKRTLNWLDTNKKGMLFGLVLAAVAAGLLSQLSRKSFSSILGNTALGTLLGAPMGLCVNCAAPVGTGLHQSGCRLETSTAAVLASPTLNVVVLSILFSMLPWHLAVLKICLTLALIFIGVPLLTRNARGVEAEVVLCEEEPRPASESWLSALKWCLAETSRNLWRLTLKVGPLMLLAGFLGSALITVLPLENLAEARGTTLLGLVGVSTVGSLLPVPVAFDVILCGLLYQARVPTGYVAVLLFTLGSFSIYSYAVFRQTISRLVARRLLIAVCLLGVLAGLIGPPLEDFYRRRVDAELLRSLRETLRETPQSVSPVSGATAASEYSTLKEEIEPLTAWETISSTKEYTLQRRPHLISPSPTASALFVRKEGPELGLDQVVGLSYREHLWVPTVSNRSIAAGDIHGDGWIDLVMANDTEVGGVTLYANINGQFRVQALNWPDKPAVFVVATALVDINNDGHLDLFWSDILGRNRVLLNRHGEFSELVELPSLPGAFVNAVGFADLDQNGLLDLVAGTWVHMSYTQKIHRGWNYVLLQKSDLRFEPRPLPGEGGNTHALLISDLNLDGKLDLVTGNDWTPADEYYWGFGDGTFAPMAEDTVPITTHWTMSIDSADLDNDLVPELFMAHIAYKHDRRRRVAEARKQDRDSLLSGEEMRVFDFMVQSGHLHDMNRFTQSPNSCLESSLEGRDRSDCLFDTVLSRTWRGEGREAWLDQLPQHDPVLERLFQQVYPPDDPEPVKNPYFRFDIPSSKNKNVLHRITSGPLFQDEVDRWNLAFTGWTWNSKFADLNLDGYQDIYVVNGTYQQELLTPNLLYLNKQGESLEISPEEAAADYLPTSNYAYIDLDNDGDLDIVTSPPNAQVRVLQNQTGGERAVVVELLDLAGHRSAVGARLTLHSQASQQMREVKASGGFNSFDDLSQTFGISEPSELEVRWPDGTILRPKARLQPGFRYRFIRKSQD